ncbi:MAG: hypothetical protein IJ774_00665 [Selenomonadaceae bacterium]|nr:hypothetical protein [Selenomonadaceae bacterium]
MSFRTTGVVEIYFLSAWKESSKERRAYAAGDGVAIRMLSKAESHLRRMIHPVSYAAAAVIHDGRLLS